MGNLCCYILAILIILYFYREGYNYQGPQYEDLPQSKQVWDVLDPEYFSQKQRDKAREIKKNNPNMLTRDIRQKVRFDEGFEQIEYFGNNRASLEWNEADYPMKTTNGLDLTPLFPQDSLFKENLYVPYKFSAPL